MRQRRSWKVERNSPNHYEGAEWLQGASKGTNNVTVMNFNAVHMLPTDLRFEHGGAKHASCPGCHL